MIDPTRIKGYHAHIYYDALSRPQRRGAARSGRAAFRCQNGALARRAGRTASMRDVSDRVRK